MNKKSSTNSTNAQRAELLHRSAPADAVCRCGRLLRPQHCPSCGSRNLYGYKSAGGFAMLPDPSDGVLKQYYIRGYTCRRCTHVFNEQATCEAPPKAVKQLKQQAKDAGVTSEAATHLQHKIDAEFGGDRAAYVRSLLARTIKPSLDSNEEEDM